jgi:hypothetical protein
MASRREILLSLALSPLGACAALHAGQGEGPPLWSVEGRGRAYVFGFGEAKDRSWLTPKIEAAFSESDELWLETPPAGSFAPGTDVDALIREIGFREGRGFYDALAPEVRERARAYVGELEVPPERIELARPWLGYITINGAFWARHPRPYETETPEEALRQMAEASGKPVRHEYETSEDVLRFFASMSEREESQYVSMLLDFLDDEKLGLNEMYFEWAEGALHERAIDRMRTKTPELYRVLQVDRNAWWADTIADRIATDGTCFVGLGLNHVIGPDGVPSQLERRGLRVRRT